MLRELNWGGIAFGAGAGFVVGIGVAALVGGSDAGTLVEVLIQFLAFVVAGFIAGRFSLVQPIAAGGFAALLLYFSMALLAIVTGSDLQPVALLFFGLMALLFGSVGAVVAEAFRRRR
jgi:hypothetical protein